MLPPTDSLTVARDSRRLVVLLHAYTSHPGQLAHVKSAVSEALPDADIFVPPLPVSLFSSADPVRLVRSLLEHLDAIWTRKTAGGNAGYEELLLVGHSFGAILARQLFCSGWGATDRATFDPRAGHAWAPRVTRIVLLAGMNRGWTVTSAISPLNTLIMRLFSGIGHALSAFGRVPIIFAIRRGAPFLTVMRLQWLALRHTPPAGLARMPLTVQLLGTRDDLVSPTDNVDLATGGDFVYLDVPHSGHVDVIDMGSSSEAGRARRRVFMFALAGPEASVRDGAVRPGDVDDLVQSATDDFDVTLQATAWPDVQHVVFVVHGIRDKGFWTKKLARAIKERARGVGIRMRSVTSTYGYFAMLPFVAPWARLAKVEWLLDQYVGARALYPNAELFSYVGHSNGTYLLTGALQRCPAVRFDRIVFAGSVVRRDFDWPGFIGRKQVARVLNYVATADWVVAIFPKGLQTLRLQDLGGAGHDGFDCHLDELQDVEYVSGRHGAALDERHWADMARFVVDGTWPTAEAGPEKRSTLVRIAGGVGPVLWVLLAVLALAPGYLLLTALGFWTPAWLRSWSCYQSVRNAIDSAPAWAAALGLAGYLGLLRAVLTRV